MGANRVAGGKEWCLEQAKRRPHVSKSGPYIHPPGRHDTPVLSHFDPDWAPVPVGARGRPTGSQYGIPVRDGNEVSVPPLAPTSSHAYTHEAGVHDAPLRVPLLRRTSQLKALKVAHPPLTPTRTPTLPSCHCHSSGRHRANVLCELFGALKT